MSEFSRVGEILYSWIYLLVYTQCLQTMPICIFPCYVVLVSGKSVFTHRRKFLPPDTQHDVSASITLYSLMAQGV